MLRRVLAAVDDSEKRTGLWSTVLRGITTTDDTDDEDHRCDLGKLAEGLVVLSSGAVSVRCPVLDALATRVGDEVSSNFFSHGVPPSFPSADEKHDAEDEDDEDDEEEDRSGPLSFLRACAGLSPPSPHRS